MPDSFPLQHVILTEMRRAGLLLLLLTCACGHFKRSAHLDLDTVKFAPGQHSAITPEPRPHIKWWMPRHANRVEQARQGNIDVVLMGDSITEQWVKHPELAEKYFGTRYMNLGYSGDRTQHLLWRLQNGEIDHISPRLAVMLIGSNNTNGDDNTPEEIVDGVVANLREVRRRLPETKILLLSMLPRDLPTSSTRIKINQTNPMFPQLADNQMIFYMDIGSHFLEPDGSLKPGVMYDGVHPSALGYEVLGDAIKPAVDALMHCNCGEEPVFEQEPFAPQPHAAVEPVNRFDIEWWKNRHQRVLDRNAKGDVEIVLLGDSINRQWEMHPELALQYFGEHSVNMGFGGDQTQHTLWRLRNGELENIKPKVVIVHIGSNNAPHEAMSAEMIADGIVAICRELRLRQPEARIVLLEIIPRGDKGGMIWEKNRKASELASSIADGEMIHYVSLNPLLVGSDGDINGTLYQPDRTHLTAEGYKVFGDALAPLLRELMAE